jgi:4-diphosphocytidyl-2-C-methyl-D-erythritol kinase
VREDGYHELVTVYQTVSLFDEVTASPGKGASVTVDTAGEDGDGGVPLDESNLALRAAVALAQATGRDPDVHLHIRKDIPVAGGMAGGSADAAAALVACDALWGTGCSREDLHGLAAELGSDVPFALAGGVAVGTGRGERITPALVLGQLHWVLAFDSDGLPTPAVYREVDGLREGSDTPAPRLSDELMAALRAGDAAAVAPALVNDMQTAALSLRPRLARTLTAGEEAGALAGMVSGSGPSCAFLARDADHALDVAARLSASGVCRSVTRVYGPVPGARVADVATSPRRAR